MKTTKAAFLFVVLALIAAPVFAQQGPQSTVETIKAAMMATAAAKLFPQAMIWLCALISLQFVITNWSLIAGGADIERVIIKLGTSLAWAGVCFYIMDNGPALIDDVGTDAMNTYMPAIVTPGSIIVATVGICSVLISALAVLGTSVLGSGNQAIANLVLFLLISVLCIGLYMAIKIFMIKLELAIVVVLSPLSFALLGLNALRDQGIAPFKSMIALVYRIILLGIICSAFGGVVDLAKSAVAAAKWYDVNSWSAAIQQILYAFASFPLLAFLVYKSDSIASSLASGTVSMGAGDVAAAAAAGAAAGAAVMSGGASAVSRLTKVPQSMADLMTRMGSGSVNNASGTGRGAADFQPMPAAPPGGGGLGGGSGAGQASGGDRPEDFSRAADRETSGPNLDAISQNGSTPGGLLGSQSNSGSEIGAGIGGPGGGTRLEDSMAKLVDHLGAAQKPTFGQHLKDANSHLAQEKASVGVSISAHHHD